MRGCFKANKTASRIMFLKIQGSCEEALSLREYSFISACTRELWVAKKELWDQKAGNYVCFKRGY